ALREDLPSDADEQRARTRLLATGAALGGATIAHHLVSHVAELKGTTTLAAKLSAAFSKTAALVDSAAQGIGLTVKVASWGVGTNSAVAVAAVAVGAGLPVAEHLRAVERTSAPAKPPEVTGARHIAAIPPAALARSEDGPL